MQRDRAKLEPEVRHPVDASSIRER